MSDGSAKPIANDWGQLMVAAGAGAAIAAACFTAYQYLNASEDDSEEESPALVVSVPTKVLFILRASMRD